MPFATRSDDRLRFPGRSARATPYAATAWRIGLPSIPSLAHRPGSSCITRSYQPDMFSYILVASFDNQRVPRTALEGVAHLLRLPCASNAVLAAVAWCDFECSARCLRADSVCIAALVHRLVMQYDPLYAVRESGEQEREGGKREDRIARSVRTAENRSGRCCQMLVAVSRNSVQKQCSELLASTHWISADASRCGSHWV